MTQGKQRRLWTRIHMRRYTPLIELSFAFVLAYWIITTWFAGTVKFEDLALGTETASYQALDSNGKLIHIVRISGAEEKEFVDSWRARGEKKVTLFLGNSQMHSINQKREDEVNFLELIFRNALNDSSEVLGNSLPNAGLQEFYLSYMYWKDRLPLQIIVIPLFMDDMREDGIRNVFFTKLIDENYQVERDSSHLAQKINKNLRDYWSSNPNSKTSAQDDDLAALKETLQEKAEIYLNAQLTENSLAWSNRQNVRGDVFSWVYRLRNTVFGVGANSIRRMIPQRYDDNMESLRLILTKCREYKHKVLLYIPPIRPDTTPPYAPEEYMNFKDAVVRIAQHSGADVEFRNYENIVPGPLWGFQAATNLMSKREVDFMHFQYRGHEILADSLQHVLMGMSNK